MWKERIKKLVIRFVCDPINQYSFGAWNTRQIEKIFVGECLACIFLMVIGCMGCVDSIGDGTFQVQSNEGISFGISALIGMRIFHYVSGGHANPAITLLTFLLQITPLKCVPVYWLGQFVGCVLGAVLFIMVTPINNVGSRWNFENATLPGACAPHLEIDVPEFNGALFEFMATFILCLAWCSVFDYRFIDRLETGLIRFGLIYLGLVLCGDNITKANMNPARSFAGALINNYWEKHWIFWYGPFLGSIFAALVYRFMIYELPEEVVINWH